MKIKQNIAISDSGFLFNATSGDSYSVNPVGQDIIKLLRQHKNDDEIVKEITDKYNVDGATVEKDLYDFKNMLTTYNLTEV